jgi:antitoxin component of RelBE/YafQ-DinJ toxin-antitoxin module
MSSVLLSIKTDEQTKQELKNFASELGVSSTAFVNMVVKQALRDKRVVLSTDLEPTPYLEQIMREADADYAAGRNITHTSSSKEALSHLDSLMKK